MKKIIAVITKNRNAFENALQAWVKQDTYEYLEFKHIDSIKSAAGLRIDAFIGIEPLPENKSAIIAYLNVTRPRQITDEVLRYTTPKLITLFLNDK